MEIGSNGLSLQQSSQRPWSLGMGYLSKQRFPAWWRKEDHVSIREKVDNPVSLSLEVSEDSITALVLVSMTSSSL